MEPVDLPALDDEPSYLEAGLWEREPGCSEINSARNLNRSIRINGNTIRFTDPVNGIEQLFTIREDLRSALQRLGRDGTTLEGFSPILRERLVALGILQSQPHVLKRRHAWHAFLRRARPRFFKHGYVTLPRLLSPIHLAWLRRRYRRLARQAALEFGDVQCPTRWIAHNEPAARIFHPRLTRLLSEVVGSRLKPSYLYLGCYEGGSILPEHIDRAQCEFSITMLVDYIPEPIGQSPWPIYLRSTHGVVPVRQRLGDAMLYRGRILPHFRKALQEGHTSTSLFFHFVPYGFAGKLY